MDFETVSADEFGASLRGLGLNILVRDTAKTAQFLASAFGMRVHRLSADFAIVTYGDQVFQLHADGTYANNPLLGLVPENPPRGGGIELRLYDSDPEEAVLRAKEMGATILAEPAKKPHGLVEAYILCDDGYAWVPSRPIERA